MPTPSQTNPCRGQCSWLFEGLSDDVLEHLFALNRTVQYDVGEMIFQEGEPAFGVYIICKGKVKLSKFASQGKKQILKLLDKGEILGEKTMFDNEIYTAHAKTLEPTTVHFLDRNTFIDFLMNYPQVALRLIEKLSREIKGFQGKLVEIAYEDSNERVARLLLMMAAQYGLETPKGLDIGFELSRSDLAELAGVSAETAIRTLSKFKDQKLIALDGHRIFILNKEKLKTFVADPFLVGLKENLI